MDNKPLVTNEPTATYNADQEGIVSDISLLDMDKLYTYAHYLKWQFTERVELIKGKIFKMSPAPTTFHQKISGILNFEFFGYLKGKKCQVFDAPFDVRFPNNKNDKNPHTVVQPDICVICDPAKIDERGCNGAPDLIIEILSPSTSAKDTRNKFDLYQEHGVKEYWIVDPGNYIIDVFVLNQHGQYQLVRKYNRYDTITVGLFPDLKIVLEEVFEE